MPHNPISEADARRVRLFRNIRYRAYPTGRDYSFTYELHGNVWRAYINNPPAYRGRPAGNGSAHWLSDGNRRYVCWTPEPTTLSGAQAVSAMWADATEHYISTGRFDVPPGRPQVRDWSVLGGGVAAARHSSCRRAGDRVDWYEQPAFQIWGASLIALLVAGPILLRDLSSGLGWSDLIWLGICAVAAVFVERQTQAQPGGSGWIVALAVSIVAAGLFVVLVGGAGLASAIAGWLAVANLIQFGYAAYQHEAE